MKNYDSFEEYMYDKYYDEIYKRINAFLLEKKHSSFLTTSAINKIDRFNLDDFQIVGSTFHINGNDSLNFRLSLTADVSVWGKSCYDYESDSKFVWLSVNFTGILKNGLHEVKITKIEEYSKERFNKEKKLDHTFTVRTLTLLQKNF